MDKTFSEKLVMHNVKMFDCQGKKCFIFARGCWLLHIFVWVRCELTILRGPSHKKQLVGTGKNKVDMA